MLNIEDNKVNSKDIYSFVEVKTRYHTWLKRCINYADLKENIDFICTIKQSTGGRPEKEYSFTIDAAKEICIVSATSKAKELRRWLISLSNQRENLDLITVKEAAFAIKVINCLKYINNQKEAYVMHQNHFIASNTDKIEKHFIYPEFAKYRAKIIGWDKTKIDKALNEFLQNNVGYPKKLENANMQTKMSVIDINEAIRIAVLDILYSKDTDEKLADNFSKLCKKLAKEMQIEPLKTNENTLFQAKENIDNIKSLNL